MFPYRDDNPTLRVPLVTIGLIVANVAMWLLVQGGGTDPWISRSICEYGLIPADLLGNVRRPASIALGPETMCVLDGRPDWFTLVTSMFSHGGWLHLLGNLWFLWLFGNNVEDSMGRFRFVAFYGLCGLAAEAAQIMVNPTSPVPMVGASGAIGGVMGAYIVLYPRVRVHLLLVLGIFITTAVVPAYLMLGYWFVLQLLGGIPQLEASGAGVAFWAHVGGFGAGVVLVYVFQDRQLVARHRELLREYEGKLIWRR